MRRRGTGPARLGVRRGALAAAAAIALAAPLAPAQDAGSAAPPRAADRTTERRAPQQDVESTHGADDVGVRRTVRAPAGWQVGVPFVMRLEATAPAGTRVAFPSLGDAWGGLEVRSQRSDPAEGGRPAAFEASLVAWDAGPAELPALAVECVLADGRSRAVEVPATSVEVGTSLEGETPLTELPAGIRDAVEIADSRWTWWVGAVLLAVAGLAGVWWLRSRGRDAAAEPPLAPHERARIELARLETDRLPERGEVEPFYVRLSDIVRAYVEGRFGIAAPDRTTQEFLREASRDPRLAGEHERELAGFLRSADMVKFAEARPDPEACGRSLEAMRSFVERTAPAPEEAAP